jgi:glucose uptake protein GlcU
MFQKKNKKWLLGVLTLVLFVPSLALARTIETELGGVVSFNEFIAEVWRWSSSVVFAVSVIAIIVGGILITSSGGNEDRADMGRITVKGSVVGIFITLFSSVFYTFIMNPVKDKDGSELGDIFDALTTVADALTSVVGALAGLGIVYAGIRYMTAGGDEEKSILQKMP